MKKIYVFLFLTVFAFSLRAQDVTVPETQLSLLTKVTADWCPLCGGWGWSMFQGLIEDNSDKAVLIAAHHSGGLQNQASTAYTGNLNFGGQPVFFLGTENQGASSSNASMTRTAIQTKVDQNYEQSPLAQTGLLAAYDEVSREMTVQTRTRFFAETEGEYYLAVYLIQRTYVGFQASQGNNAEHKFVLREFLTGEPFGILLADGAVSAGQESDHNLSFDLGDYDPANLQIATVIWRKVGDDYEFVNANYTNEINQTVSTGAPQLAGVRLSVGPNPVQASAQVTLQLDRTATDLQMSLVNGAGQTVQSLFQGTLPAGEHRFELTRPATAGSYVLLVRTAGQVATRQVVFQ